MLDEAFRTTVLRSRSVFHARNFCIFIVETVTLKNTPLVTVCLPDDLRL